MLTKMPPVKHISSLLRKMKSRIKMISATETVTECHYDSAQWCQMI